MKSECTSCDWNGVYIRKLEAKYDKILKVLASEVELTEAAIEELHSMIRVKI